MGGIDLAEVKQSHIDIIKRSNSHQLQRTPELKYGLLMYEVRASSIMSF